MQVKVMCAWQEASLPLLRKASMTPCLVQAICSTAIWKRGSLVLRRIHQNALQGWQLPRWGTAKAVFALPFTVFPSAPRGERVMAAAAALWPLLLCSLYWDTSRVTCTERHDAGREKSTTLISSASSSEKPRCAKGSASWTSTTVPFGS